MAEIENRGPQLFAVDVFFMTLAIVTTLLRCYVRLFLVKSWGIDDWFMLGATVGADISSDIRLCLLNNSIQTAFTLFSSFSIAGTHFGTGRHFADLTEYGALSAMKVHQRSKKAKRRTLLNNTDYRPFSAGSSATSSTQRV